MSVAVLTNIEKTFGKQILFDRLNLTIYEGERIGFIGANGSGKTTLFRVIAGQVVPDQGTVAISKGVKVGHLTQDPAFDPENSLMDEAELAFSQLHELSHRLRELEQEMAGESGEALEKTLRQYQTTQHEFELEGGYAWRHRLEATLLGVGLEREAWNQNVQTLSGGQRSRLALAKLLIGESDLLLLDEPTNHLDLDAVEWLERYLLQFKGAVVLISHDRFLLDRLATRIVWLHDRRFDSFNGNYSNFVQQRDLLELTRQRAYEQQQAEIEKQQEFIRRFQAGQRAKEARGRATRLQRLLRSDQVIEGAAAPRQIRLALTTDQRAGDRVLQTRQLAKGFGNLKLWEDVTISIGRGERIGIIGPNGSGKTTLLRVLLGQEAADAGESRWGANLKIGYYDQRLDEFDAGQTVFEAAGEGRDAKAQLVRDVLAAMLFRGDDINKTMGLLSGGERARVRLVQLLLDRPNVLILDEPTNHLDIPSREALEAALAQFTGTLLCVSHDRYFLDKLVRRLLILRPPAIRDCAGNYSAWMRTAEAEEAEAAARAERMAETVRSAPKAPPQRHAPRPDNPYLRPFGRLTLEELEQEIHRAEVSISQCQRAFADPETFKDAARRKQVQADYDEASLRLRELEQEYFAREA